MSSLVKNNNNFRKAANKVLQQTRTINNLKPEITVEQTFDEPLFVKNMIFYIIFIKALSKSSGSVNGEVA